MGTDFNLDFTEKQ